MRFIFLQICKYLARCYPSISWNPSPKASKAAPITTKALGSASATSAFSRSTSARLMTQYSTDRSSPGGLDARHMRTHDAPGGKRERENHFGNKDGAPRELAGRLLGQVERGAGDG